MWFMRENVFSFPGFAHQARRVRPDGGKLLNGYVNV
jgi:hypothetical protein